MWSPDQKKSDQKRKKMREKKEYLTDRFQSRLS
jgi:hypothetical protein